MPTISADQFFKGGNVSVVGNHSQDLAQQQQQKKPSLIKRAITGLGHYAESVGNDYMGATKSIIDNYEHLGDGSGKNGNGTIGGTTLRSVSDFVSAVFAPVAEAVKPVINKSADILSNNQTFSKVANSKYGDAVANAQQAYQDLAAKHPEGAKNFEAALNIALAAVSERPITKATEGIGTGLKSAASKTVDLSKTATQTATEAVTKAKGAAGEAITKATDMATPIEPSVMTEAQKASIPKASRLETAKNYIKQAEVAMADNSAPTPLELAGNKAKEALTTINSKLKQIGTLKKVATDAVGKKGAGTIVSDALTNLENGITERFGGVITKTGDIVNAKGRALTFAESEKPLVRTIKDKLESVQKFPTVQRVDDAIGFIQKELYKSEKNLTLPANTELNGFLKEVVGQLNKGVKEVAGKEYTNANAEYARVKYLRDNLNKALGVEANKGASLMKQLFSPSGSAPRKMFDLIKKETGIDLVNEATLAKFAMENVGDIRQESLLKQILTGQALSKRGIVGIAADKIVNKIQDPTKKLIRTIQNSK